MQTNQTPEVCPDRIVGGILRGMRRRGLPANVDTDDLRQEGLIALMGQAGTPALMTTIARNAMVYALRRSLLSNKRYYTGQTAVDDIEGKPRRTADPFFTLDVDGLEARHLAWERERAERWA